MFAKRAIFIFFVLCILSFTYASSFDANNHYHKSTWQWLDLNNDGIYECYYFNVLGHMFKDGTTPDGYKVNENGEWVVNGIVQRKSSIEVKDLVDM